MRTYSYLNCYGTEDCTCISCKVNRGEEVDPLGMREYLIDVQGQSFKDRTSEDVDHISVRFNRVLVAYWASGANAEKGDGLGDDWHYKQWLKMLTPNQRKAVKIPPSKPRWMTA